MAANSFIEMSRSLRLYCPSLPITLAEQFIRDRYRRILERRDWSALRREGEFQLSAPKEDGTVTFVRGSESITGNSTTFTLNDVGRQFKTGTSPIYTIVEVNQPNQILNLDRGIGVADSTAVTYKIFDGYVTPPVDFIRFINVTMPQYGYRLRHWISGRELDAMDPQKVFFGQPFLLADRIYNIATAGTAQPQPTYDAWPYAAAAYTIYYTYIKRGDDLIDPDDIPIWPLRSDVIVTGALADVARWPGTKESPNPYFARVDSWLTYQREFEDLMIDLERQDEDIYLTWLMDSNLPFTPSTNWIQTHAV